MSYPKKNFFMKQQDVYLVKLFSTKGLSNAIHLISPKESKIVLPKLNLQFPLKPLKPLNKKNIQKKQTISKVSAIPQDHSYRHLFKNYSYRRKNHFHLNCENTTKNNHSSLVLSPIQTNNKNLNKFFHNNLEKISFSDKNVMDQGSQTTFYLF